jgi:hypothetical protein
MLTLIHRVRERFYWRCASESIFEAIDVYKIRKQSSSIATGVHIFWFGDCDLISYIHNSQHSIGRCTTWFSPYVHCFKHMKRDISFHKRAHCYIQKNHIYSNKEAIAYAIILYLDFHSFVSATSDMSVVNKTDRHDITEILLKVTPRNYYYHWGYPSPSIDDNSRFCLFKSPLVFLLQKHLSYLAFQSFDFERTWWRLSQKLILHTKLDIYVFISDVMVLSYASTISFKH